MPNRRRWDLKVSGNDGYWHRLLRNDAVEVFYRDRCRIGTRQLKPFKDRKRRRPSHRLTDDVLLLEEAASRLVKFTQHVRCESLGELGAVMGLGQLTYCEWGQPGPREFTDDCGIGRSKICLIIVPVPLSDPRSGQRSLPQGKLSERPTDVAPATGPTNHPKRSRLNPIHRNSLNPRLTSDKKMR